MNLKYKKVIEVLCYFASIIPWMITAMVIIKATQDEPTCEIACGNEAGEAFIAFAIMYCSYIYSSILLFVIVILAGRKEATLALKVPIALNITYTLIPDIVLACVLVKLIYDKGFYIIFMLGINSFLVIPFVANKFSLYRFILQLKTVKNA